MKVLVTGSVGFIGSALCIRLLARGDKVIGIDNHNAYYDPALKESLLRATPITRITHTFASTLLIAVSWNKPLLITNHKA